MQLHLFVYWFLQVFVWSCKCFCMAEFRNWVFQAKRCCSWRDSSRADALCGTAEISATCLEKEVQLKRFALFLLSFLYLYFLPPLFNFTFTAPFSIYHLTLKSEIRYKWGSSRLTLEEKHKMTGVYYCDPFITATHCHILGYTSQRFDKCAIRTRKHPWRYAFGNLQVFPKTHSRSHHCLLSINTYASSKWQEEH